MTLEETLDRAEEPPPEEFPDPVVDDKILAFFLGEQFEYRVDGRDAPDLLGWEANAWLGGDYDRLAFKPEGEATFHSPGTLETESDILYSRLVWPFWSVQVGVQYANEWTSGRDYEDRWSAALALQGLAPGKFEVDVSVYLSDDADVTSVLELEYDWRLTQRLVAQPRAELALSLQAIDERNLGAGLTDVTAGLRLRYEVRREIAPYLGIRFQGRLFDTADRARDAGDEVSRFFALVGARFALL